MVEGEVKSLRATQHVLFRVCLYKLLVNGVFSLKRAFVKSYEELWLQNRVLGFGI